MKRREFVRKLGQGSAGLLGSTALRNAKAQSSARPPNFVLILADDLGWADLPSYGNTFIDTPYLDRLTSQGMRFTDAYAGCPVCSPTRASLLTGCYPARLNLTDFIPGHFRPYAKLTVPEFNQQLPPGQVTLAEALKSAGYVAAMIGKWHLGGQGSQPEDHGFDVSVTQVPNQSDKWSAGLTTEALRFVEANRNRPFLLYLAHHNVHIPLEAPKDLVAKYEAKARETQAPCHPTYAAMVETLDRSVGQVMQRLEDLNLARDTLLIFFSDNGGLKQRYDGQGPIVTSNAPLRGEKGMLYEGGIRVPLIVQWPEHVRAGTTCSVPVTSADFLPTMIDIVGLDSPPCIDGVSLRPPLEGESALPREALFWHYPHYHHSTPAGAIRRGRYKLLEFYEEGTLELYDLKQDLGEQHNLVEAMPQRAARLQQELAEWRQSVGAKMPTLNPNYDPERAAEWGTRG
ncbi:MAG: sulfatase [Candidatus Zipacnadales bacterium]